MSTINDAVTILVAQQKPLADKLKTLETSYRAERALLTAQLKPLNKAINTLTPKAPKPGKAAKKVAAKEAKDVTAK